MGKTGSKHKTSNLDDDPIVDQFLVASAKTSLLSNMIGMGWRLAVIVLIPIFIGVQIDKRLDSAPSMTLAAFFIAIFAASLLIYKTYVEMTTESKGSDKRKSKRPKTVNRSNDV